MVFALVEVKKQIVNLHQMKAFSSLHWTKKAQNYLKFGENLFHFEDRSPQCVAILDSTVSLMASFQSQQYWHAKCLQINVTDNKTHVICSTRVPLELHMNRRLAITLIALLTLVSCAREEPLKVGYSDWPGWVTWEIAIEKNMFAEVGVNVEFEWFDYVASMDAFAAGQLDAVAMTNGDALVTGATGAQNVMILINDYSNGNDMIVAAPGISTIDELKGKKVGVEIGFVGHLLLLNALEKNGLTESDVELVNVPTNETPQVLASGEVDAIVAWQPNSGQSLNLVPGSTAIYTSADEPGLIYDVLAVSPTSFAQNRKSWAKVIEVWDMAVAFLNNPETREEAISIMAARVGLSSEEYKGFLEGTKIMSVSEASVFAERGDGFTSIYGSTKIADDFNVANEVYDEAQPVDSYIDLSLMQ